MLEEQEARRLIMEQEIQLQRTLLESNQVQEITFETRKERLERKRLLYEKQL